MTSHTKICNASRPGVGGHRLCGPARARRHPAGHTLPRRQGHQGAAPPRPMPPLAQALSTPIAPQRHSACSLDPPSCVSLSSAPHPPNSVAPCLNCAHPIPPRPLAPGAAEEGVQRRRLRSHQRPPALAAAAKRRRLVLATGLPRAQPGGDWRHSRRLLRHRVFFGFSLGWYLQPTPTPLLPPRAPCSRPWAAASGTSTTGAPSSCWTRGSGAQAGSSSCRAGCARQSRCDRSGPPRTRRGTLFNHLPLVLCCKCKDGLAIRYLMPTSLTCDAISRARSTSLLTPALPTCPHSTAP